MMSGVDVIRCRVVRIGALFWVEYWCIRLRSVVASHSLSLAQAGGVLIVGHGVPVAGGGVVLALVRCIGTEQVRGDVDHSGGDFAVMVRVKRRSCCRPQRRKELERAAAASTQNRKRLAKQDKGYRGRRARAGDANGPKGALMFSRDGAQDGPDGALDVVGPWKAAARCSATYLTSRPRQPTACGPAHVKRVAKQRVARLS